MTATVLRTILLKNLEEAATAILLTPEPPTRAPELVGALEDVYGAYNALMVATSRSNRGYEERDLPVDELECRKRVKHVLGLLYRQHVEPTLPQDGSS